MAAEARAVVEDRGDHMLVTLSNPQRRNALSPAMYADLRAALDQAAADDRIGAVVLTGASGYFCAGGDLNALAERAALSREERRTRIEDLHATIRAIRACSRPVIAAVEGGAAGAGFSIALACDLLVAAEDASFAAAYVRVGLVPDGGLTASLARRVPASLAARLCLTGDPVGAPVLAGMGVVTDLCAPGQAHADAARLAARLARGPAGAQAAIKRLLADAYAGDFDAQMQRERDAMADALASPEAAAGIRARLDRTVPDFGRGAPRRPVGVQEEETNQ
ncbi:oxepin-CoA hydrolase, alternative type [Paracoccus actinidiae]|uniref:oxepin-CoA hydrolase, alternative type n=1 Tax=Paracoccus actinidiae TaxID=3064531 RepID=UPI0027D224EF|nr:enoyl-CoA hydratase family protein [Paracoccus sp. M09]